LWRATRMTTSHQLVQAHLHHRGRGLHCLLEVVTRKERGASRLGPHRRNVERRRDALALSNQLHPRLPHRLDRRHSQKQACKVRFGQEKVTEPQEEISTATAKTQKKKPVKQSTETAKGTTMATKKGKKTKVNERPTTAKTETEVQQTPAAATSAKNCWWQLQSLTLW